LLKHLDLINKAGKLVREDSEFGRIITSREHIFANGVDVRKLLRDLGKLILWNNEQKGYNLDNLIQMVETSNRQKHVVRIVERSVTRVTEPNVSLVLKSAELILLMSAIVNILNCKESSKLRGMSPVSMENIALFVPARRRNRSQETICHSDRYHHRYLSRFRPYQEMPPVQVQTHQRQLRRARQS
jgi:hypothetical protein